MKKTGFTLIELLLVFSILAILFACSLPPLLSFSRRLALNVSARSLASDLRTVQSRAMLEHKTLSKDGISFSPSGFPPPGGGGTLTIGPKKIIVSSVGRVRVE